MKGITVYLTILDAMREGLLSRDDFSYFGDLLRKEQDLQAVLNELLNTTMKSSKTLIGLTQSMLDGLLNKDDFIQFTSLLRTESNLLKVYSDMHNYLMQQAINQSGGKNGKHK